MSTVHEAVRVANHSKPPLSATLPSIPVYPYSRHSYDKAPGHFYSKVSEMSCDVHSIQHMTSCDLPTGGLVVVTCHFQPPGFCWSCDLGFHQVH